MFAALKMEVTTLNKNDETMNKDELVEVGKQAVAKSAEVSLHQ